MDPIWTPEEWETVVDFATSLRPPPIEMVDFHRRIQSYSQPCIMNDAAGQEYVVKPLLTTQPMERALTVDQIVSRLGMMIGAPVGEPDLVFISDRMIEENKQLQIPSRYFPGIAHASKLIPGCHDGLEMGQYQTGLNRPRYALLAVLYGLAYCDNDHQVIFQEPGSLVYSVDHGNFFLGGPDWTIESLRETPAARVDPIILHTCGLSFPEYQPALQCLKHLNNKHIAYAVASPPASWEFTLKERGEVAYYIAKRRNDLIAMLNC